MFRMFTIPEEDFLKTLPQEDIDPDEFFPDVIVDYLRDRNKLHVLQNRVRPYKT